MSFVQLCITDHGIVAVADQKSTLVKKDGTQVEDVSRGKVQKIFKNNKFIMVTYGLNEVVEEIREEIVEGDVTIYTKRYVKMPIEKWINDNLTDSMSSEEFFEKFVQLSPTYPHEDDPEYGFIVGVREKTNYTIQRITISADFKDIFYGEKLNAHHSLGGGDKLFAKIYDLNPHYFYDRDIEETASLLVDQCNKLAEYLESLPTHYNPVGIEFVSDTFI